jgi:hypothetical protein
MFGAASTFSAKTKSNWYGFNQALVDDVAYKMCKDLHRTNPWAKNCVRVLRDFLFQYGIAIYWGGKPIQLTKEFKRTIERYWIPFAVDVIEEICTRGIVPVILSEVEEGVYIPVVPKSPHVIRTYVDPQTDMQKFAYYRLYSRKTGQPLKEPKLDKKVMIFSGYGFDPSMNGTICSLVSSILKTDAMMTYIDTLVLKGEKKRADPQLVVERPDHGAGDPSGGTYFRIGDATQAAAVARSQKQYYDTMLGIDQTEEYNSLVLHSLGLYPEVKEKADPPRDLPIGSKLVHQILPQSRTDWTELHKEVQEVICSAYGVPRSILNDAGRSAYTGMKATEDTLIRTVLNWRRILSDILTEVYHCIYSPADCEYMLETKGKGNPLNVKDEEMRQLAQSNNVIVTLPIAPQTTQGALLTKYVLGFIDYPTLKEYSLKADNLMLQDMGDNDVESDPFTSEKHEYEVRERLLLMMKSVILQGTPLGSGNNNNNNDGGGAEEKKETSTSSTTKKKEDKTDSDKKDNKRKRPEKEDK